MRLILFAIGVAGIIFLVVGIAGLQHLDKMNRQHPPVVAHEQR